MCTVLLAVSGSGTLISAEEQQLLERLLKTPPAPRRMLVRSTCLLPCQQLQCQTDIITQQQPKQAPTEVPAGPHGMNLQQQLKQSVHAGVPEEAAQQQHDEPPSMQPGQIASVPVAEWIAAQPSPPPRRQQQPQHPAAAAAAGEHLANGPQAAPDPLFNMESIRVSITPRGTRTFAPIALHAAASCGQEPGSPGRSTLLRTRSMADVAQQPVDVTLQLPFAVEYEEAAPDQAQYHGLPHSRSESELSLTPRSSEAGYSLARSPFPSQRSRALAAAQLPVSSPASDDDEAPRTEVASYDGDASSHGPHPLGAPHEDELLSTTADIAAPDQEGSVSTLYQDATEEVAPLHHPAAKPQVHACFT